MLSTGKICCDENMKFFADKCYFPGYFPGCNVDLSTIDVDVSIQLVVLSKRAIKYDFLIV